MSVVAIHQPNFLPWLGFFDKMDRADVFVLLDRVQLIRRATTTGVNILQTGRQVRLTVPVQHVGSQNLFIDEAIIQDRQRVCRKISASIRHAYSRQPHWKRFGEPIAIMLESAPERLVDLNIALIRQLAEGLGISWQKVRRQSELHFEGRKSALMASLTRAVGGTIYLSGGHDPVAASVETARGTAADYNDPSVYQASAVSLVYQNFVHPQYDQRTIQFVPGLSALDALVRLGPEAMQIVRRLNGRI